MNGSRRGPLGRCIGMALAWLVLRGGAPPAGAQEAHARDAAALLPAVWTIWTATATNQSVATRLGERHDRGLYFLGLQRQWRVDANASRSAELLYTVDLVPLVVSTRMRSIGTRPVSCGYRSGCETVIDSTSYTAYAAGVMPLGLLARVRVSDRLALRLHAAGGALYFTRAVPDSRLCRLNFTADAGAAMELRVAARAALATGLRMNHISNGDRCRENPGMDSRMLQVGLSLAR